MEIKHLIVLIGLVNILLTASITAFVTFIGIKRMLKRKNIEEKYMILRKREVSVLDGKEIYELTDNAIIKSLIDKNEVLQNENDLSKIEIQNLKKEQEKISFRIVFFILIMVIFYSIKNLFQKKK